MCNIHHLSVPVFVVGIAVVQPNKEGVLANLKKYRPIMEGSRTIDVEELRTRHPLSLRNGRP
jgi:hypothetical protein